MIFISVCLMRDRLNKLVITLCERTFHWTVIMSLSRLLLLITSLIYIVNANIIRVNTPLGRLEGFIDDNKYPNANLSNYHSFRGVRYAKALTENTKFLVNNYLLFCQCECLRTLMNVFQPWHWIELENDNYGCKIFTVIRIEML